MSASNLYREICDRMAQLSFKQMMSNDAEARDELIEISRKAIGSVVTPISKKEDRYKVLELLMEDIKQDIEKTRDMAERMEKAFHDSEQES